MESTILAWRGKCCEGQHWDKWGNWNMGCILAVLSVSLYTHTHTHTYTHTSAKSQAHMCKCILEMCNHNEEFNRCQGLNSFQLSCQSWHCIHIHTHTALPEVLFSTEWSNPVKVKPGEFPASAPEATSLDFRFWDTGSARRLAPAVSSLHFLRIQQRWRGRAGPQPAVSATVLPKPRRCPWQLHGYHPFCLQPDLPQNHTPAALRQPLCDVNHLFLLFNPCPRWAISRDSIVGSLSPQSQLSHKELGN